MTTSTPARYFLALCTAATIAISSGGALAHERDRDARHGHRHHHSTVLADRHREKHRHHKKNRKSNKGCFECRVDKRQARLNARVRDGWLNGDLTRGERKKLKKRQRRIERMERRFAADGKFTRAERKKLTRALDRASDKIYQLKHNDNYRIDRRFAYDYASQHPHWFPW